MERASTQTAHGAALLVQGSPISLADLARQPFAALLAWQARVSERAHLRALDDRLLKDMGLSRADVAREAAKPFWRA